MGLTLASACAEPVAPPPAFPPPEVTVARPVRRDVVEYEEFTGETRATRTADVRARVQGVLERTHFSPSQFVRRGDMLFTIEQAPYLAARRAAEADVGIVEADLARLRSDLARLEQAIRTNAVSEQEVDRARADIGAAEAKLLGAQARLEQAELDVGYTLIRAPISGMISRSREGVGNLVRGSATDEPLATIVQIDPIYAYFEISEALILGFLSSQGRTLGRPETDEGEAQDLVYLGLSDEEGWPHEGRMNYIDNTVNPETGTVEVRGTFPNPTGKLFPGLFARIRLPGFIQNDAVLVEETAIGTDLGGRYVLVVGEDDVVELRHVETGGLDDGLRVIRSGLAAGERYIVNGLQRARPGLPVTPVLADPTSTSASASR